MNSAHIPSSSFQVLHYIQLDTQNMDIGTLYRKSIKNYEKTTMEMFSIKITAKPKTTVENPPPIKPSHVFFGDNLINGVLPKKKPNTYAIISLHIIIDTGTMNHIKPSNIFFIIKYDCVTTINRATCVQANNENCFM